jgi:uncharacterized protein (TIGR00299 family) protein
MSRRSSTGSRSSRGRARSEQESGAPAARRAQHRPPPGARILHLDCFSGIAGNMFLGALLDAGLVRKELEADLAGLSLDHALVVRRVRRGALAARYLDVRIPGASRGKAARPPHGGAAAHGRSYVSITRLIARARLDPEVRERALAIFEALGRAEARVHGVALEKVHFHEVGAVDAIVDVTGAAIALARLGVARVTASPVALGEGAVETAHGRLPLPAPATLELLRGIPTVPAHVQWETVTPTGAAILRSVVDEFRALPAMTIESVGHGAGNDRPGPMPNVLRAILGRSGGASSDRVVTLETNLDDLVPEHFDHLMERLFDAGALDVSIQHLQMKKNAIGVRASESDRLLLHREQRRVATPFGRIGVKVVWDAEGRADFSPEYDDCKRAARKAGVALREVVRAAEEAARSFRGGK